MAQERSAPNTHRGRPPADVPAVLLAVLSDPPGCLVTGQDIRKLAGVVGTIAGPAAAPGDESMVAVICPRPAAETNGLRFARLIAVV